MSQPAATSESSRRDKPRPDGQHKGRPGGLISSDFVARANPVLPEDIYSEPIRVGSVIKMAGDYVRFFDGTDSLLRTISAVYNNSPTTRSIIRQKATLAMGDGFMVMKGRANTLFPTLAKANTAVDDPTLLAALDDQLMEVNDEGESLADVFNMGATEYLMCGNSYVILSRVAGEKKLYCHHAPFAKGRLKERNEEGRITHVGFNERWKDQSWTKEHVTDIPLYPVWEVDPKAPGVERTVIHLKDFAPGFEYYGLPEWIASMLYAEIEYRIAKFNSSKFDNGFVPSGILQFFGATSAEEGQAIVRDVKRRYVGTGKNGGLFIQVLRDETLKAHYTALEDNSEGAFLELTRVSAQAIVSAHRWTMSLAGFATKGQLGSNEQIRREFEIAYNTVIRPIQQMMLRRFVNVFMKELGELDGQFKGLYLDIANSTPVSFIGDINVDQALTRDEKRQLCGYEPLPKQEQQQPINPGADPDQPQIDNGSLDNPDPDSAE